MRRLHLNAMLYGLGCHIAAWRFPDSDPLAVTRLSHWCELGKRCEAGGFDAVFLGDTLAIPQETPYQVAGALDPLIILSALACTTSRIGLIGTASTTFDHAYYIARRFASLDHISQGRAGWNIVTTSTLSEAKNFGRDVLAPHEERYARASDVLHAVIALWNSWKPSARIADKKRGLYLDPAAIGNTNYIGSYIRSIGPLDVPCPPQRKPLLMQGGDSEPGRDFASRYADISLTVQCDLENACTFYADIKQRARNVGRDPDKLLVFPGIVPIIGKTKAEAQERFRQLNALTLPQYGLQQLSAIVGHDLTCFDCRHPLPPHILAKAEDKETPNRVRLILRYAQKNNLSLDELAAHFLCAREHLLAIGTAEDIADTIQHWFENRAADGFNVIFPSLLTDIAPFCREVIPLLEKRGLRAQPQNNEMLRERFGLDMDSKTEETQPGTETGKQPLAAKTETSAGLMMRKRQPDRRT